MYISGDFMIKLKVIDLDVWGNQEEGFEINNFFNIGEIEFPKKSDPHSISKSLLKTKLVSGGFLKPEARRKIDLDDCSSMDFFYQVTEKKTGKPLYNIEVV